MAEKEYIERESVYNDMLNALCGTGYQTQALDVIRYAPAADVQEVRYGKWEEIRDAYGQLEGWMCKECGREMKAKENYCPNCGAKWRVIKMNREIQINGVYRHFKGNFYRVLGVAKHTETNEMLVLYNLCKMCLNGFLDDPSGNVYARPIEMFMSKVDREKYPESVQEYRFALVEE